ncbi:glucose-methanol-choline oxidoreductasefamily protein, partial [Striga asiatica]
VRALLSLPSHKYNRSLRHPADLNDAAAPGTTHTAAAALRYRLLRLPLTHARAKTESCSSDSSCLSRRGSICFPSFFRWSANLREEERSNDPILRFNYFSNPVDVEKCVNGTRKIGNVLKSRSMQDFMFCEWFGARNFRFVGPALPVDQFDYVQMAFFCRRIRFPARSVHKSQRPSLHQLALSSRNQQQEERKKSQTRPSHARALIPTRRALALTNGKLKSVPGLKKERKNRLCHSCPRTSS